MKSSDKDDSFGNINHLMSNQQAMIDQNWFTDLKGNYPVKIFKKIIEIFFEDVPTDIDELKRYLTNGDLVNAKVTAHKLKGACLTLGAVVLADLFEKIEEKYYDSGIEPLKSTLRIIDDIRDATFLEINRLVAELHLPSC
ncbi:MAG: Hpt domain-containing protein [Proteobacteria bacterium]|nr:Hpt domain-containing protein [Pseudomonadota bacterium]